MIDQQTYEDQVQARADEMLDVVAERDRHAAWTAHALLARGKDPARVTEAVSNSLGEVAPGDGDPAMGGPFHILPAMLLYSRWEEQLTAEAEEMIRSFMLRGVLARGNTENHWLMYYTGNLLAAERWRDETEFWDGRPPVAMQREATRWILGTIERTARIGHHEYDSPGYHIEHMMPLIGLYEHTTDEHLRTQVGRVLTLMTADMALEFFHGSWAGSHSREGYRENTWTRVGPIRILQYLYFGGEPFDPEEHLHGFGIPALVARYRPPALFARMAWERPTPQVVKKTKAPRNIIRHSDRYAGPVHKTTYMSKSFALGTAQINLPGTAAGPIDLVSWDLTWAGAKHQAKITCNHPFQGPERFSVFLGPYPQNARRAIGSDKPYLQSVDRLFGASPFERVVQHEGAAIIAYRIPEEDEAPFANLFLPTDTDWLERSGWLLGDMGDFYVGVRPLAGYHWERIRESRSDAIMVRDGDLIDGWLLRIDGPTPGLALEAAEATTVTSFEDFCVRRAAVGLEQADWPGDGRVALTMIAGDRLELEFDGVHRLNGDLIDYDTWPLYGAPEAEAEMGTGRMRFGSGEDVVEVDFGIDPELPLMPMRVIG
ncbi:MAG: hypothetical protein QGI32_22500 [Candidatus Latescibacteria bacterium]|nr:hypothetical protein [Gemmatimonadaceae bacterium]MDP6018878.1 hypothetical protein [Candidatus Latescibacterota bacterium]